MSEEQKEPRVLQPFMKFSQPGPGFKDQVAHFIPVDQEAEEVEEAITPVPKAEPAQESVTSSELSTVPQELESLVPPNGVTPTEALEAAVKENGKGSGESEDVPPMPSAVTPQPDPSSPSSSSETSPGKPTPPAPVKPPTGS